MNIVSHLRTRHTAIFIAGLFAMAIVMIVQITVASSVNAAPGEIVETTNPGSRPNWTIISQRVDKETVVVNHRQTYTFQCVSGTPTNNPPSTWKSTTVRHGPPPTNLLSVTTVNRRVNDGQGKKCQETTSLAWVEHKTTTTRWYIMQHIPFSYTPKTTVDRQISRPGDIVTFNHTIATAGNPPNTAPAKMSTDVTRVGDEFKYSFNIIQQIQCNFNPANCYFDNRLSMLPKISNRETNAYNTQITIGKDTPENVKICYFTSVTPSNQNGGSQKSTDEACTTVKKTESLNFNLEPKVTAEFEGPAEPGVGIDVRYDVANTSSASESSDVDWKTYAIEVLPGVDVSPITNGSLRESVAPQRLIDAIGGNGKARIFDVNKYNGKSRFPASKSTQVARENFQIPDDAAIGSKFCFVLYVEPPTQNASPSNRHSLAKCINVGKRPKVNIWGGDLYVGRRFVDDTVSPTSLSSTIQTSVSKYGGPINRAYGSWTEYDAHAPGVISGFATASGLQGGLESTASDDQAQWSKLTFANNPEYYGGYGTTNTRGNIPDAMTAATRNSQVVKTFEATETSLDLNTTNSATQKLARYDKPTGDLVLNGGTLQQGKSIVVTVPNGKLTIAGNLNYAAGPYRSVTDIPQLIIIAKNIVINGNVTNVDSWLVAKGPAGLSGDSSGVTDPTNPIGTIKTCETVEAELTVNTCNQQLLVNGPVMANQIFLRRTAGLAAPEGDTPPNDQPAEIFNLRADTYLWIYSQGKNNARAVTTFTRELGPRF